VTDGFWPLARCPSTHSFIPLFNKALGENKMKSLVGLDTDKGISYLSSEWAKVSESGKN